MKYLSNSSENSRGLIYSDSLISTFSCGFDGSPRKLISQSQLGILKTFTDYWDLPQIQIPFSNSE